MSETPRFSLPLMSAAQAQKHVTVNEALVRLEAATAARLDSVDATEPPENASEGAAFGVPALAGGAWGGHDGDIAFRFNSGWNFLSPFPGFEAWISDRKQRMTYDGATWIPSPIGNLVSGASTFGALKVGDEPVQVGAGFDSLLTIPDRAIVLGVTARVLTEVTGSGLSSWRVGVVDAPDRYGNSIGLAAGSSLVGVTSTPVAYYGETRLRIEPEGGGQFASGVIRLAVHYLSLTPPKFL